MRVVVSLLITFSICFTCFSQSNSFIHYDIQDGLPSNTVYFGFEDHQGFLWFTTSAGVSRFDGYEFTNYSTEDGLGDNEVFFAFEDSKHRIWFSTLNGKVSYYQNGKIFNGSTDSTLRPLDKRSRITGISEMNDGTITISFFGDGVLAYDSLKKVREISKGKDDFSGIYFSYVDKKDRNVIMELFHSYVYESGKLIRTSADDDRACMKRCAYLDNRLYFACTSVLYVLDSSSTIPKEVCNTHSYINNICKKKDGQLWICTKDGALSFPDKEHILPGQEIAFVHEDSENNTWVGTLGKGLYFSSSFKIENFTKSNGLKSNIVTAIKKDREGNIWMGHDQFFVTKMSPNQSFSYPKSYTKLSRGYSPKNHLVTDIHCDEDGVWVQCIEFSVYITNDHTFYLENAGGKEIMDWFGSYKIILGGPAGMVLYNHPATLKDYDYKGTREDDKKEEYTKLYRHRTTKGHLVRPGNLWVGLNAGLINLQKDTIIKYHKIYNELDQRVTDIVTNSLGVVFIATYNNGLYILNDGTLTNVSIKDGLTSNLCTTVELSNDHVLWIGTNNGLNKVSFDESFNLKNITFINSIYGLASSYINDILNDGDTVWLATPNGVSRFSSNIEILGRNPPKMRITGVHGSDGLLTDQTLAELPDTENSLKIDYVGLSYQSQKNIRYKYRLESYSVTGSEWKYTKNRSVEFSSLSPDSYTFQVAAQNSSGTWSEVTDFTFIITPPYWQTAWFIFLSYSSLVISIGFIGLLIFRRQRKKEVEKQFRLTTEIRELKSQMNFHFLSNAFSSMQRLFISNTDLYEHIEKFSLLMRYNLEHVEQDLVALEEELNYLRLYVSSEQTRTNLQLALKVIVDPEFDFKKILIPSLSLQPFVENAIKHGILPGNNSGDISIYIRPLDHQYYSIMIEDNGVGYDYSIKNKPKGKRKSHGMNLVKDRFRVITQNTDLEFLVSIADRSIDNQKGTRVTMKLPLIT